MNKGAHLTFKISKSPQEKVICATIKAASSPSTEPCNSNIIEILLPGSPDSLSAPIALSGQINSHPTKQQESRSDVLASALPVTAKKRNSKLQRFPCRGTRVMIKYYSLLCKHLKQELLHLPSIRTRTFRLSFKRSLILRQNTLEYLTCVFGCLIKRIVMIITGVDMTEVENS